MAKQNDLLRSLEIAGVTLTEAKLKEFSFDGADEEKPEVPAEEPEMSMDDDAPEDVELPEEDDSEFGKFMSMLKATAADMDMDVDALCKELEAKQDKGEGEGDEELSMDDEVPAEDEMSMDDMGEEGAEEPEMSMDGEVPAEAEGEDAPNELDMFMADPEGIDAPEGEDVPAEEPEMAMDDEAPVEAEGEDEFAMDMPVDAPEGEEDEMAMDAPEGEEAPAELDAEAEMYAKEPAAPKPEDIIKASQTKMDELIAKLKVYKELLPLLPSEDKPHFDNLIASMEDEIAGMDVDVAFSAGGEAPVEAPAAEMRMDGEEAPADEFAADEMSLDAPEGEFPVEDEVGSEADKEMKMYMADMEAYMKDADMDINSFSMKDAIRFDREGMKMHMANMSDDDYNNDEDMKMYMKMYMKQMYMDAKGLDETTMRKRFMKNGAKVDAEARDMYNKDKEFHDKEFRQMYMADIGYH